MDLWNMSFKPMLLDETEKPFDSEDYLFEIKFDGIRTLVYVTPKTIKIVSRNLIDMTNLYPELQIIKSMVKGKVIFDGEIIGLEGNKPSFSKVQKRVRLKEKRKIQEQSFNNPVVFVCFDIIYENKDITNMSLIKRKELLNKYEDNDYFVKSKVINDKGISLFKKIKKHKLEGIIAKKKNSIYEINTRTKDWIKIKNYIKEVFYIGGYYYKNDNFVFSVLLGEYINNKFNFVGKMFISKKNKLFNLLLKEKEVKSKFVNNDEEGIIYVNPKYCCEVQYIERTEGNNLRQPVYIKTIKGVDKNQHIKKV